MTPHRVIIWVELVPIFFFLANIHEIFGMSIEKLAHDKCTLQGFLQDAQAVYCGIY